MVQVEFLHFATFAIYSWEQWQKEELWGKGAKIAEGEKVEPGDFLRDCFGFYL